MIGRSLARRRAALTLVAVVAGAPACNFAVNHPAVTTGVVAGSLAFGTCNLASDGVGTCAVAGGAVGALLGLVAATALWLGGDGHSVLVEDQAQPLPDDVRPARGPAPPDPAPAAPPPDAASPAPVSPAPASPAAASPAPSSPAP